MTLGEKIKRLRIEKGLSQEDLGKMVGVQRAAINKYEKGVVVNLKREVISKLAVALDTSPIYLMGWEYNNDDPIMADPDPIAALVLLPPNEQELVSLYRELNEEGQDKLLDYANDLVTTGKYI